MNDYKNHPLYKVYTIDTVMNSLWEYYKKNFLVLFIVSLVISFITQYISSTMLTGLENIQAETDPTVVLEKVKEFLLPFALISLISLLFTIILQHYIIFNPVDKSVSVFKSVIRSFKYYIPFLIIIILLSFTGAIAIVFGVLLLVVGAVFAGIYIATIYLFILPVMIVEDADIFTTISRVFSLSHRNFWTNFGWVAVFLMILVVTSMVLSGIVLLPFSASFIKTIINPGDATELADMTKSPLFIILSSIVNALTIPLMPIFSTILYFNGKAKEDDKPGKYMADNQEPKVRVEDLYAKPYSDDHPDNPENKKDGVK
jgi:hypothetical protein